MAREASLLGPMMALLVACTPSFTPPRESTRIKGVVEDSTPVPVEVEVYERCSPQLYFFKKCPGKLLGHAKIAKPGPFLVEIDTSAAEVSVFAFRGVPGQEEACVVKDASTAELSNGIELSLAQQACPVERPPPKTGSARAPISGF